MQPWRSLITFRTAADLRSSCSSKMILTQRLKNPSNLSDGINPFPEHNEPGLSATRHSPSFSYGPDPKITYNIPVPSGYRELMVL